MEDNALKPNTPQPLAGDGGSLASPVAPNKQSAMGSFLRHFGVGKPDSPPVPETTPDAPSSDFASRLNSTGTPPMAGADVVAGPNLASPEVPITQPPQEPQMTASDLGGSTAPPTGEQTIGVGPSSSAETPSTMGTPNMDATLDLAGLAINTPAQQDLSISPNPVSSPEAVDDDKAMLAKTRESLASIADQADQMKNSIDQQLKELDERLGTSLSNEPVDATAGSTPKEPVGVGS